MPLLKPANILGIRNSLNEVQDHDLKYILSEKTFIFIIFQFVTLTHIVQNFSYKNKIKKKKQKTSHHQKPQQQDTVLQASICFDLSILT